MRNMNLTIENISLGFGSGSGRVQALNDVSLAFAPDGLTLVMGRSGSGKTSLLSILGCLLKPDSGGVFLMNQEVTHLSEKHLGRLRRQYIGYVFQAFRLFHALSAIENVMLALQLSNYNSRAARRMAADALEQVGLENKLKQLPKELSGGEKQRVAIARALVTEPKIILADEPTASLDSRSGEQIAEILHDIADDGERIVIVVSHDSRWLDYSRRIITMKDGRMMEDKIKKSETNQLQIALHLKRR